MKLTTTSSDGVVKDISWTALWVIVALCAAVLLYFYVTRDTSGGEIKDYSNHACVYMDDAFRDGTLTPSQRQFYIKNC
jgi:hypothetical protein